ncbi:DUF1905 domain-containing protein [Maribellus sp. YY47]|uniref:DUF1905 domain-containing protein n=1 Tax=Maribellus sp. YY47 TaxID=2929486 RepID=UPI002001A6DD|nr:DUF1905 domain-containing protein [Maribellus sp. YY47]MCK3685749.1 DUF1905 domain-containing protein [Maribellus sp. YY47]
MQIKGVKYTFKAEPWQYKAPGGWFFVSFPADLAEEIRNMFRSEEEGWGRLKATAKIGNSEWKTAIWFDTKQNTYFLPLKAEIRKKENIATGKEIQVTVWI